MLVSKANASGIFQKAIGKFLPSNEEFGDEENEWFQLVDQMIDTELVPWMYQEFSKNKLELDLKLSQFFGEVENECLTPGLLGICLELVMRHKNNLEILCNCLGGVFWIPEIDGAPSDLTERYKKYVTNQFISELFRINNQEVRSILDKSFSLEA